MSEAKICAEIAAKSREVFLKTIAEEKAYASKKIDQLRKYNKNLVDQERASMNVAQDDDYSASNSYGDPFHFTQLTAELEEARYRTPDPVVMESVSKNATYTVWVPIRTDIHLSEELKNGSCTPCVDTGRKNRSIPVRLSSPNTKDKCDTDLSDLEVNEKGKVVKVRYITDSLRSRRYREAWRRTCIKIHGEYGYNRVTIAGLSRGLVIKPQERMERVFRSALILHEAKATKEDVRKKKNSARMEVESYLQREISSDSLYVSTSSDDNSFEAPMKEILNDYCIECRLFGCDQHMRRRVPLKPICDPETEKRMELILNKRIAQCSEACYLRDNLEYREEIATTWNSQQLDMLLSSLPAFDVDPCRLASVIPFKSCSEIHCKLDEILPDYPGLVSNGAVRRVHSYTNEVKENIAKDLKKESKRTKKMDKELKVEDDAKEAEMVDNENSGAEEEAAKRRRTSKKPKKLKKKQNAREIPPIHHISKPKGMCIIPCYHEGDCILGRCPCVQKGIPCEPICGCNNVRFSTKLVKKEGSRYAKRPAIQTRVRYIDQSRGFSGEGGLCMNLTPGCRCVDVPCNTESCPCWRKERSCNPDICVGCMEDISRSEIFEPRCCNLPIQFLRRKKTILAKSDIQGIGLFAVEAIEKNEMICVYAGVVSKSKAVDNESGYSDGQKFHFEMEGGIVLDSARLGSRGKFINHAPRGSPGENCVTREVSYHSKREIAIFSNRRIEPGEEIRFSYHLGRWGKDLSPE